MPQGLWWAAVRMSMRLISLAARQCIMRREAGIDEPLDLVLVDLVGAASQAADAPKLSSSGLRESEAND